MKQADLTNRLLFFIYWIWRLKIILTNRTAYRNKLLPNRAFSFFILALIQCFSLQNIVLSQKQNLADSLGFIARKDLEISREYFNIRGDTLSFYSESDFIWYPFGVFKNIDSFKRSHKKMSFIMKEHQWEYDDSVWKTNRVFQVTCDSSTVLFYDETLDIKNGDIGTDKKGIIIISGVIRGNCIAFSKRIRVGMSKRSFFQVFFTKAPDVLIEKVHVIEIISALDGMWHYYVFDQSRLARITFKSDDAIKIR